MSQRFAHDFHFTSGERAAVLGLASLYALRMLGMFLLLPAMSLYVPTLRGATPLLIGLSMGAYGLSQAVFQVPFGAWSDRFGRRRVLVGGLIVFAVGSFLGARATTAWGMVLARATQGAGAIAATIVALLCDLTRPQVRAQAMSALAFAVGASWACGLVLGPTAASAVGVPVLFQVTAALSLVGAVGVIVAVPRASDAREAEPGEEWRSQDLKGLLWQGALMRLNLGIFILHVALTSLFVIVPQLMARHLPLSQHGRVYAPIVVLGLVLVVVSGRAAERRGRLREAVLLGGVALAACQLCLARSATSLAALVAALAFAVAAVAVAQPSMPALVSHLVPVRARGTAAGLFHVFEFSGSFLGGTMGGALMTHLGALSTALLCGALAWVVLSWGLPRGVVAAVPAPPAAS
jgi:MFS family permease